MRSNAGKVARITIVCATLLFTGDALAFRYGSRLITEGMPESEVIALCGEPVSIRHIGYVLRPYFIKRPAAISGLSGTRHAYAGFHEELPVTEMLFNFGPRKLMRLVRFEGGRMVSTETAGYGHRNAIK